MNTIQLATLLTILAVTGVLPGQNLRRAVAAADLVLLGQSVRVIPTKTHVLHRIRVVEVLRGQGGIGEQVTVAIPKQLSVHNQPVAAATMLMCLHDVSTQTADLPAAWRPYYKMSGHAGSAVVLAAKADEDPRLAFARVLVASWKGQASRQTAEQLFAVAIQGDPAVRTEAAESLCERPVLLGYLTSAHLAKLLARAAGETDDIGYKIALCAICAEQRMPELIPSMCLGTQQVGDEAYLRALGRFAAYVHRDQAAAAILPQLQRAGGTAKQRLIVALGATSTEEALDTLLALQREGTETGAVEAALRIHGSPRATAAIARKQPDAPIGK